MKSVVALSGEERRKVMTDASEKLGLPVAVVEKDFWVCWLLARIFSTKDLGADCVFKGGTSLSKVFGVVQRFSEDIDISISPGLLGVREGDLESAPTSSARHKLFEKLQDLCKEAVEKRFQGELESEIRRLLPARGARSWLTYDLDAQTDSPILRFAYPDPASANAEYIEPSVKLEFGSLTDQRPTAKHPIAAMVEEAFPGAFDDTSTQVVALELERTFWEKATILHAEHHRPADKDFPSRHARHYSDFVALWRSEKGQAAASQLALLDRVVNFKKSYFPRKWAKYEEARPGSLRLRPTKEREEEVRRDYAAMESMFLGEPLSFAELLLELERVEKALNSRG